MAKIYEYELSISGLEKLQKQLSKLEQIITTKEFKDYIGERLQEALTFIQRNLLTTIKRGETSEELSIYMNSNHLEIDGDTIYIYNDATIDITNKNMKETTKANYPAQLSLAKIVEYGIGYIGATQTTNLEVVEDWEYDVNQHGIKGWYYKSENGEIHWTNGYAGRLIFFHLKEFVEKSIETWIIEYINDKI